MKWDHFTAVIRLIGAFAILFAASASSLAQECVQITVKIERTNQIKLGRGPSHWDFTATCGILGDHWRIQSRNKGGISTVCYDGTNVYSRVEPDPSIRSKRHPATINIKPSPGGHPLGSLEVNLPWLAFCSGSYLKRPGRIIPLPMADVPDDWFSLSFVDKTTTFDDEGGLPKTVELLTSKEAYLRSIDDERLYRFPTYLEVKRKLKSGTVAFREDGLTASRYEVEATTNFHGRTYPTRFRYFGYRDMNVNSGYTLVSQGTGTVASIGMGNWTEGVFMVSTNQDQNVLDGRFRQPDKLMDCIFYYWSKAEIPPTNDPALLQKLAEERLKAEDAPSF